MHLTGIPKKYSLTVKIIVDVQNIIGQLKINFVWYVILYLHPMNVCVLTLGFEVEAGGGKDLDAWLLLSLPTFP